MPEPLLDLNGLLGETAETLSERFGVVAVDRVLGEDRWMVFEGAGWSLRIRARPQRTGGTAHVRSWTVTFERPTFATLRAACLALALPVDEASPDSEPLRTPLPDLSSGLTHSLTAVERAGFIRSVTGFDEPPDWGARTGPA